MGWSIRSEEPRQNHQKDMKMIITRVLYQEITSKSLLIFGYAMEQKQESCLKFSYRGSKHHFSLDEIQFRWLEYSMTE